MLARLTGSWVVDHSVASGTGLMDLERLDWDGEALAIAGIEADRLAELVPTTHVLELAADVARRLGLAAGTPVVAGAGDGPLANLGLGAVRPGVAACSIGTSGALRVVVERAGRRPERGGCTAMRSRPGAGSSAGRSTTAASCCSGRATRSRPTSASIPRKSSWPWPRAPRRAATAWSCCPTCSASARRTGARCRAGAYVGLTRAHGREHLVRAALEGVCQQLALVLASVREAGNEVREVRATGGFARSELWRRILAAALGMPVGFAESDQGSAFGAALLGMEALGLVETIEHAAELVQIGEVVEPDPHDAAVLAELLPTFAGLYDALEPTFRALASVGRHEPPARRERDR